MEPYSTRDQLTMKATSARCLMTPILESPGGAEEVPAIAFGGLTIFSGKRRILKEQ